MQVRPGTIARPREVLLLAFAAVALAILMTWPLATGLSRLGRTAPTDADGQFSIWNVSWVARTLVADPLHVFDANIFAPHRTTLAYSEANLLPGVVGIPAWWLTRNPWLTLNTAMLLAFASAFAGAYLFFLYVSGSRPAAAAAGVLYAFCPYVMSHLSHIQLLFTGGIPLSLYWLHRLADACRREPAAGEPGDAAAGVGWTVPIALGLTLAAQALACAYYGVFAGLIVGYATLVLASTRRLWRSRSWWQAIATAGILALAVTVPVFIPYLRVQRDTGFARTVDDTARWAARPIDYLVSAAHAHAPLLDYARRAGPWLEVLFPGYIAVFLGAAGIVFALRRRSAHRETALVYGTLGLLALWASFGPRAGLYRVLYDLPTFSFLRAPSRLGLVVIMVLALFACLAISDLLARLPPRLRGAFGALAVLAAIADVAVFPIRWFAAPVIPDGYATLTHRARAPVAEFPFYGDRVAFPLHAQYMLFSTAHWLPLVNGYSDVIPADFRRDAPILDSFPSSDAFAALARHRVRYITVHWDMYVNRQEEIRRRLEPYRANLNELSSNDRMTIYEVIAYP
ncbi:MAG TPA: hypothetical protein VGI12_05865 [Vicinamibacterales bacterium]|jgi:hypothetical protein